MTSPAPLRMVAHGCSSPPEWSESQSPAHLLSPEPSHNDHLGRQKYSPMNPDAQLLFGPTQRRVPDEHDLIYHSEIWG